MWNYVFLCLLFLVRIIGGLDREEYEFGFGIADITGPAAEIGMVSTRRRRLLKASRRA